MYIISSENNSSFISEYQVRPERGSSLTSRMASSGKIKADAASSYPSRDAITYTPELRGFESTLG